MADNPTAPIRPLVPRRPRPQPQEEWTTQVSKEAVSKELRDAVDDLRIEREADDQRAKRAAQRGHETDRRYWQARADGISVGLAAVRDALFHLTGEEY
jgi:hypothetical protein